MRVVMVVVGRRSRMRSRMRSRVGPRVRAGVGMRVRVRVAAAIAAVLTPVVLVGHLCATPAAEDEEAPHEASEESMVHHHLGELLVIVIPLHVHVAMGVSFRNLHLLGILDHLMAEGHAHHLKAMTSVRRAVGASVGASVRAVGAWGVVLVHLDDDLGDLREALWLELGKVLDNAKLGLGLADGIRANGLQRGIASLVELVDGRAGVGHHHLADRLKLIGVGLEAADDLLHVRHVVHAERAESDEILLARRRPRARPRARVRPRLRARSGAWRSWPWAWSFLCHCLSMVILLVVAVACPQVW
mmetsp:Transcript_18484/g.28849  ORF Transcript_18484/g.28849 Transcript_18484/m.28849 type:complete len:302 (+) Transcript_18484:225-1130(+)